MLKIAVTTDGPMLDSTVCPTYAELTYLLIVDAESGKLLRCIERADRSETDMAREIVAEDCEAVITGPIEEAPFVIIADEGCCTRYDGAKLPVLLAVDKMNGYVLPLLTDYIGGTGCHPGDESNCQHHHH